MTHPQDDGTLAERAAAWVPPWQRDGVPAEAQRDDLPAGPGDGQVTGAADPEHGPQDHADTEPSGGADLPSAGPGAPAVPDVPPHGTDDAAPPAGAEEPARVGGHWHDAAPAERAAAGGVADSVMAAVRSELGGGHLADRAAAWVPPWQRPLVPASADTPPTRTPDEPEPTAASNALDDAPPAASGEDPADASLEEKTAAVPERAEPVAGEASDLGPAEPVPAALTAALPAELTDADAAEPAPADAFTRHPAEGSGPDGSAPSADLAELVTGHPAEEAPADAVAAEPGAVHAAEEDAGTARPLPELFAGGSVDEAVSLAAALSADLTKSVAEQVAEETPAKAVSPRPLPELLAEYAADGPGSSATPPADDLPAAAPPSAEGPLAPVEAVRTASTPAPRRNGTAAAALAAGLPAQLAALDPDELRAALEAILLVVDEPVGEIMLAQVLEQPTERVFDALVTLAESYTAQGRGFELRRAAGGWRLYTREAYAPYVERFILDGQSVRLTQAALETLAVVAYKQPVTRSRISAIRGVNCDGVVRTLVSRGLIEECGAEPDSGAHLYRTTGLFLEKLGLDGLDQLPPLAPFLPDNVEELSDAQI